MPRIIPTVRSVDLIQLSENDFVWLYSDGQKEELGPHHSSAAEAKAWIFTPVFINSPDHQDD